MIGIGVVGVGEMGKRHAENVRRHVSGARLVAIADANLERAKQVAAELEIENYCDSVEALVARKEINAIVIVSPPKFHPQAIQVAAAAKKHILCEKPLALISTRLMLPWKQLLRMASFYKWATCDATTPHTSRR